MAALTITTAKIPSGDSPVCGVALEPYVVVRRGDQNVDAKDCAEEGSGDARFSLRFRWYRSTVNKGGAVCFFHQVGKCNRLKITSRQQLVCPPLSFRSMRIRLYYNGRTSAQ